MSGCIIGIFNNTHKAFGFFLTVNSDYIKANWPSTITIKVLFSWKVALSHLHTPTHYLEFLSLQNDQWKEFPKKQMIFRVRCLYFII